ncbi:MAG: WbqC family protein [Bacteroidales bacterium]|jgi:hypothetical protein|nr:WbqC family protein [Bacteroidales bacterium]
MGSILLSTAYFPPISWVREALNADKIFIEAWETYPKQTYRNRCRIAAANGPLSLSVPVTKVNGKGTMTKDIRICYDEDWQRLHRRSMEDAYTNSPFYLYFWDEIRPFFEKKFSFLLDLNMELTFALIRILGKKIEINFTDAFEKEPAGLADLRNSITPKLPVEEDKFPRYPQVFEEKSGFQPDLSVIDLIFNEGPASLDYFE